MIKNYLFILAFLNLMSCASSNDFSNIPELKYMGLSKSSMIQSSLNKDSLTLTLGFQDGDGDIGHGPQVNTINLVVLDKRTNKVYGNYKVPAIPEEGANNGVKGKIYLKLYSTCCIYPNIQIACEPLEGFPTNELVLDIYMKDRAGNQSNTVTTEAITLFCN